MSAQGWGGGPYGKTAWGGGGGTGEGGLTLVTVIAIRENVVRLGFNEAPFLSGILDPHDASSRHRYSMSAVIGTIGMDGKPTRAVAVVKAERALIGGEGGRYLDVTTDRSMSPFPAQYRITANNLYGVSGSVLDPATASQTFYGVQRERVPALPEKALLTRDLANPFSQEAVADIGIGSSPLTLVLGGFVVNESRDLAFDEGLATLKKRMLRRAFTRRGAFTYMPEYGMGLMGEVKKLQTAGVRHRIAADAEAQYKQEPELAKVRVSFTSVGPLVRMVILGRTRKGSGLRLEQLVGSL